MRILPEGEPSRATLEWMSRQRAIDIGVALAAFAATVALLAASGVDPDDADVRSLDWLGVLLAALSSLPLVFRRQAPLGVYVATIVPSAVLSGLNYPHGPPIGPAIALYFLVSARPPARSTIGVVVTLFAVHVAATAIAVDAFPTVPLLFGTTLWLGIGFAADRVRLRRERVAELEERALRAEREAERERRLAAAEERTRIARELHDSAGHAINVILVQASAARLMQDRDPERTRAALGTIEDVARDTVSEIDRLVHALREEGDFASALEPLPGMEALETLAERHRAAGLTVETEVSGTARRLAPGVDRAAYRILQEALTNAARHGQSPAQVELRYDSDALEITVTNRAPNARPGRDGGHGIAGMRERAVLLGGTLEAGPSDGAFRLRARLPYRSAQT
jgi:signal transduction histidine kinase